MSGEVQERFTYRFYGNVNCDIILPRTVVLMKDSKTKVFDYEALSRKYSVAPEVLNKIVKEVRGEFGEDDMMVELHIVRTLRHIAAKSKPGVIS